MAGRILEAVANSRTYRVAETVRGWAADSVTAALLAKERVQLAGLGLIVVVSVASVLGSNLGAGVKFLSFALLFVGLAWVTARFVDPPGD